MRGAKGISTVIAVVLLLLITVGIIWLFSTWITGTTTTVTERTGELIETRTRTLNIDFSVKAGYDSNSNTVNITVTNTGPGDIDLSKVAVFIKGFPQTIKSGNSGTISPGNFTTLIVENTTEACNQLLVVSYYGVERNTLIEC